MKNICLPAKIHIILYIIFCIWGYYHYRNDYKNNTKLLFRDLLTDALGLLFFTFLLNYLCGVNYKNTAWFLLALFMALNIFTVYMIKKEKLSYFEFSAPLNM